MAYKMKTELIDTYQKNIEKYTQVAQKLRKQIIGIALIRLFWFVTGAVLAIVFLNKGQQGWALASIFGFGISFLKIPSSTENHRNLERFFIHIV